MFGQRLSWMSGTHRSPSFTRWLCGHVGACLQWVSFAKLTALLSLPDSLQSASGSEARAHGPLRCYFPEHVHRPRRHTFLWMCMVFQVSVMCLELFTTTVDISYQSFVFRLLFVACPNFCLLLRKLPSETNVSEYFWQLPLRKNLFSLEALWVRWNKSSFVSGVFQGTRQVECWQFSENEVVKELQPCSDRLGCLSSWFTIIWGYWLSRLLQI